MKWTIKGMHCASCEGLITDILQDHGASDIKISAKTGELSFTPKPGSDLAAIKKEIVDGGYKVV